MTIEVEVAIYNADTGKPEWYVVECQSRKTIDADVEQWCAENLECDFDVVKIVVKEPFGVRLPSSYKEK